MYTKNAIIPKVYRGMSSPIELPLGDPGWKAPPPMGGLIPGIGPGWNLKQNYVAFANSFFIRLTRPSMTVLVWVGPAGKPRSRIAGCIVGSGRMCIGRSCRMPIVKRWCTHLLIVRLQAEGRVIL